MISLVALNNVLSKERFRIQRTELDTDFMKGMTQGLFLASVLALQVWKETKDQICRNPTGKRGSL